MSYNLFLIGIKNTTWNAEQTMKLHCRLSPVTYKMNNKYSCNKVKPHKIIDSKLLVYIKNY